MRKVKSVRLRWLCVSVVWWRCCFVSTRSQKISIRIPPTSLESSLGLSVSWARPWHQTSDAAFRRETLNLTLPPLQDTRRNGVIDTPIRLPAGHYINTQPCQAARAPTKTILRHTHLLFRLQTRTHPSSTPNPVQRRCRPVLSPPSRIDTSTASQWPSSTVRRR